MTRKKVPIVPERTEVCKNCRATNYQDMEFTCRRHPPTPVYSYATGVMEYVHPPVSPDHWCSDFLPILNS